MRAFRIAYDGANYHGFQRQPHDETIEDELFDALDALGVAFENGAPRGYAAAGRTDAGVSARAQTVAFEAPEWLSPRAFNSELTDSVRAWASAEVDDEFHATFDADERLYRYFLYAPTIDNERMSKACRRLSGTAEYHNFTPDDDGTDRTITLSPRRDGEFVILDCRASGFSRQLVRRLVTAVSAVGHGERPLSFLDRALDEEPLSGPDGIAPADPEPLVLLDVRYSGVDFEVDETALESAHEIFNFRRRRHLAAARVADSLSPER